ncbi:nuclease-related domain-containing protein [Litchfieldia alkalitelluris]|uniref:nuclease-related domain-containing protein n=1 Tax=Litchfieldia alkalitelluris TaxID=304268 RepID=UPI0009983FE6|nr:nuclease-related domain-containing protein [Litchfieldia alkalitelluris]
MVIHVLKQRSESEELLILRSLKIRTNLMDQESYYFNLEKGLQGELLLDEKLSVLTDEWIALDDLLFEINNTIFQIDKILITQGTILIFEVKNYEGDYLIEGDQWYVTPKKLINNPLDQLKRSDGLFQRMLQELGLKYSIRSYLVFVNPEFHLYQCSTDHPIIFPTQLERFIKKLSLESQKLNDRCFKLANLLLSRHIPKSPYLKTFEYTYNQLAKGITCVRCQSFTKAVGKHTISCDSCGLAESVDSAVLRTIEEFTRLFPDMQITSRGVLEWCMIVKSKKTILRILSEHFKLEGHSKSSHYIKTDKKNSPLIESSN